MRTLILTTDSQHFTRTLHSLLTVPHLTSLKNIREVTANYLMSTDTCELTLTSVTHLNVGLRDVALISRMARMRFNLTKMHLHLCCVDSVTLFLNHC